MTTTAQQRYDALVEAIDTGAQTIEYAGKRTTFRGLNEMLQLRRALEVELGITDPVNFRKIQVTTDKDLGGAVLDTPSENAAWSSSGWPWGWGC